jgi:sec-independent protein translocase protein TatB
MFDIGFSELMVIGVVALVVIGPERLPKVARTLGVLFGRMQRYVTQVKSDISREMELAELGKVKSEFESAARSFQAEVESKAAETERELLDAKASIEKSLEVAEPLGEPPSTEPVPEAPDAPGAAVPDAAAGTPQLELGIEEPQDWKARKPSSPT